MHCFFWVRVSTYKHSILSKCTIQIVLIVLTFISHNPDLGSGFKLTEPCLILEFLIPIVPNNSIQH